MFTLKFCRGSDSFVVSCAAFDVNHEYPEGADPEKSLPVGAWVHAYPTIESKAGSANVYVGYPRATREPIDFDYGYVCFIENEAGKTIDKIGSFGQPLP